MVSLFVGASDAKMEAEMIHGVLESNGIYSIVSGTTYPPVGFEVKVAREHLEEAQRLVQEAQAAGPGAAEEAETGTQEEQ
jgi:Putative prokaryotic signal transducing protein